MDRNDILEKVRAKLTEQKTKLQMETKLVKIEASYAHERHARGLVENPWLIYSREYGSIVAKERKSFQKFAEVFQMNIKLTGVK